MAASCDAATEPRFGSIDETDFTITLFTSNANNK